MNKGTKEQKIEKGSQVLHSKNGHIWTVVSFSSDKKRCFLRRITDVHVFKCSAAVHFLKVVKPSGYSAPPKPQKVISLPTKKVKAAKPTKKLDVIESFELVLRVLQYIKQYPFIGTKILRQQFFPNFSLRTVQRFILQLVNHEYLAVRSAGCGAVYALHENAGWVHSLPLIQDQQ